MFIEGIFQIKVPLPNNPLKSLNSYLILPSEAQPNGRALLIDTGFDHPEARSAILEQIDALGLSLNQIDLLATHLHSDHSGQISYLKTDNSQCYASQIDGPLINEMTKESYWQEFLKLYTMIGLDEDGIDYFEHPGYKYCPKTPIDFIYLKEGQVLSYGDFNFTIIEVPGHTPGQIVLMDLEKSILISADHILDQITPNISFWGFEHGDSLGIYLKSLDKIRAYQPRIALPAHRNVITDVNGRIDALIQHHEERLAEVYEILMRSGEPVTARNVAVHMHWSVRQSVFAEFPSPQKWFASAEAMAHLLHLEARGLATMSLENNVAYFSVVV
jgi:glyoxylase-like metal-dependent hydrolase (beta-lactamase superfamily II)